MQDDMSIIIKQNVVYVLDEKSFKLNIIDLTKLSTF